MDKKLTKQEKSWILYDVANSAFILLVATTIPILFRGLAESDGVDPAKATGIWGMATSGAILVLAVLSPILGALADYKGMKKKLFLTFQAVGVLALLALSGLNHWASYLVAFLIARIGYTACNVFYDSMLTDVTDNSRMDKISSYGYALGYIGSCIPFIIGIVLVLTKPFGLSAARATQISFLITAVWWAALSIPLLRHVRQTHYLEDRRDKLTDSFRRIGVTLKKIKSNQKLFFFMLAYFCYIDGVYTIISMATTYGGEVGIGDTDMILALLLTQFVAFPFALLSAKIAERYGTIRVIRGFILMYCGICVFGYQLDQTWEFWVLAVAVGIAQGGIQSLSRSYFGKLIPKEESNEYFGFFDIFGKFADFFGPLIVSFCAFTFGKSNYGILALLVLFAAGYILLLRVKE